MERTDESITWHTGALPQETLRALEFFAKQEWLKNSSWYLAGGTALALQGGHRVSVDLDFFLPKKDFAVNEVLKYMPEPDWQTDSAAEGTIYGTYRGAKMSFIAYPFFVPKEPPLKYGTISVLAARDIAVMKIVAISQRGRKRDFIDLYWYCLNYETLIEVLRRLPGQYPTVAHDYHHILKAMLYFADAEDDPMPELRLKASWEEVKAYFRKEVPAIAKKIIGLE